MLTDAAQESAARAALWLRVGGYALATYALAQHVPTVDALAIAFACVEVLRAIGARGAGR